MFILGCTSQLDHRKYDVDAQKRALFLPLALWGVLNPFIRSCRLCIGNAVGRQGLPAMVSSLKDVATPDREAASLSYAQKQKCLRWSALLSLPLWKCRRQMGGAVRNEGLQASQQLASVAQRLLRRMSFAEAVSCTLLVACMLLSGFFGACPLQRLPAG